MKVAGRTYGFDQVKELILNEGFNGPANF